MSAAELKPLIRLEGGPCHGQGAEDMGTDVFYVPLVDKGRVGAAKYEVSPDRTTAFWVSNAWEEL